MILTRRAKRLAVPVIVCTILPLAVHFAWRFLTSRWWISAAGLLEALSFLSRDRNFDYFPDDHSTSKKSVFSPVDDKSQLPSTRLLATLLRDVVFGNARDPRKRPMSGDRGRSREDRKDYQHSRRLLGYTQTRIRVQRRKRKACKMQRAVAIGLDPLRGLGSQFDRRGTLSHAYRSWDCSTERNNPALEKQRTRTYMHVYVRDGKRAGSSRPIITLAIVVSTLSTTVDDTVRDVTQRRRVPLEGTREVACEDRPFANPTRTWTLRIETDVWRSTIRARNACQAPAVVSAKMRVFISPCFLINQHVVENCTTGWFATSQHMYLYVAYVQSDLADSYLDVATWWTFASSFPASLEIRLSMLQRK